MVRWVVGSILHGGPIELFFVPARARCSSVVRAFAHGVMGHRIDPSWTGPIELYHSLCYTSLGTLAGMRNSSVSPPWRIDPMIHRTMSECSYHGATSHSIGEWMHQSYMLDVLANWVVMLYVMYVLLLIDGSRKTQFGF